MRIWRVAETGCERPSIPIDLLQRQSIVLEEGSYADSSLLLNIRLERYPAGGLFQPSSALQVSYFPAPAGAHSPR